MELMREASYNQRIYYSGPIFLDKCNNKLSEVKPLLDTTFI